MQYKWDLSREIYEKYNKSDKKGLKKTIKKIEKILILLPFLFRSRKKLWYYENKRYGYEVLEQRFGGLYQRLMSISQDLEMYIKFNVKITELEEKRLPMIPENENDALIHYNRAQRIVSASKMIW